MKGVAGPVLVTYLVLGIEGVLNDYMAIEMIIKIRGFSKTGLDCPGRTLGISY